MTNLELLKAVYHGFQNGNMAVLFSNLAEDAVWKNHGSEDSPLPIISQGADEIMEYFQAVETGVELRKFDIKHILESNDTFTVLIDVDRKYKTNGSEKQGQYVHVIQFNEESQLTAFDAYEPRA